MTKQLFTLPIFLFSLFLFSSHAAYSLEVSADGINQRQALNAALRQAVEMSLGTQVEANTLVENFQVVRQQILNHTRGYVKSYKVLKEENLPGGLKRITIKADVDNQSISNSAQALSVLMKMSNHPRVMVAGIDDDFDAISSLSDEFRLLTETVESIVRDDFKFDVLDMETVRLGDKSTYRFSDRKNNLKRAKRANAAYVIFVQILKSQTAPFTLRLESVDVENKRTLAKEEIGFNMADWTSDIKTNRLAVIEEAKGHIYAPSAQIAAAMTQTLQKDTYQNGKRFELSFSRFDEKFIKFLEADLSNLSGYIRHQLQGQEKNALTLSYWSLLKPGTLHEEISTLLKNQDIPFDFQVRGATLTYRFDDPMFE